MIKALKVLYAKYLAQSFKYLISIKLCILISKYLIKTKTTRIYGFGIWYITCNDIRGIRLMHPLPRPAAVMYFRTGGLGRKFQRQQNVGVNLIFGDD